MCDIIAYDVSCNTKKMKGLIGMARMLWKDRIGPVLSGLTGQLRNENKFLSNTIAVYDGKDKNNQDLTYFFDFKAFNYVANKLSSQAQKGVKIAIEGVLKQDKWEDENGKHSKVVIYADNIEIMDAKKETNDNEIVEDKKEDLPF